MPPMLDATDPVERDVTFTPSKRPYDPREMLAGCIGPEGRLTGFFDEGTFQDSRGGVRGYFSRSRVKPALRR